MGRRIGILGLVGGALLLPCLAACDDLTLPQQDGGTGVTPQPDGGNPPTGGKLPDYAPPNAIAGDVKQELNTTIATWATLGGDGKVNAVGWNLPLAAVSALEGAKFDARVWMNVPEEVKRDTSITGIGYDYLAIGHVPNGVYNVAHWEFHVVFQDFPEVQAITCSDPTLPAPNLVPQGWGVLPPPDNCFSAMGIHAINFAAPEFNAQRFTYTNLLVYYRGDGKLKDVGTKLTSFEPKATVQLLKERKTFTIPFPAMPANAVGRPGMIPSTLTAEYNATADAYVITVSGFQPST